jgi:hypothetical protein
MKGLSLLACTAVLAFTGFASAAPLPPQRPIHDNPVWFSACATGQYAPRSDMDIVLPRMATSQKEQQGNPLYTITEGYNPSCDAYGFFDDTIESVGWAYLHTESNPALSSPWQRAYSSAYLEGYLTWNRVWQSLQNSLASTFPKTNGTVPPTVYKFIADQAQYIQEQISSSPPTSAYWTQVNAVYGQVEGQSECLGRGTRVRSCIVVLQLRLFCRRSVSFQVSTTGIRVSRARRRSR